MLLDLNVNFTSVTKFFKTFSNYILIIFYILFKN